MKRFRRTFFSVIFQLEWKSTRVAAQKKAHPHPGSPRLASVAFAAQAANACFNFHFLFFFLLFFPRSELTEPACKWRAIYFILFIYFRTSRLGTRLRAKARPKKNVTGRLEKSKQTMKKRGGGGVGSERRRGKVHVALQAGTAPLARS